MSNPYLPNKKILCHHNFHHNFQHQPRITDKCPQINFIRQHNIEIPTRATETTNINNQNSMITGGKIWSQIRKLTQIIITI
jgi:hypothetical protein